MIILWRFIHSNKWQRHMKCSLTLWKRSSQSWNPPPQLQVLGVGAPERRRSSSWSGRSRPGILPFGLTRWIRWSGRLSRPDAAWPPRRSCWCECWPRRTWTPSPYPGQWRHKDLAFALGFRQTNTKLYFQAAGLSSRCSQIPDECSVSSVFAVLLSHEVCLDVLPSKEHLQGICLAHFQKGINRLKNT